MITLLEVIYLIVTTLVVGFIFSGIIKRRETFKRFDFEDFKFACMVAAPGIIMHELGHKFSAIFLGLQASFHIWPTGLVIGIILKLIGSGFILIAPGYVSISAGSNLNMLLVALAGPLVNLIFWLVCGFLLKKNKGNFEFLFLTKEINKWLFIFNMIPIPPLDGSKVLLNLIAML